MAFILTRMNTQLDLSCWDHKNKFLAISNEHISMHWLDEIKVPPLTMSN